MDQSRKQWEEEIYPELQFQQAPSDQKVFTFEAEKSMALICFADQNEANIFVRNLTWSFAIIIDQHFHEPKVSLSTVNNYGPFCNLFL